MQFQYNSDYPIDDGVGAASRPYDFPPAQPIPCARITTRVYHPIRNIVQTVENVLIPLVVNNNNNNNSNINTSNDNSNSNDDDSMSSSSSSSFSDDESMDDTSNNNIATAAAVADNNNIAAAAAAVNNNNEPECAYWIQRTVREAIYGRVLFAVVLQKQQKQRNVIHQQNNTVEWIVTKQHCAIKEMSWQHIRKERDRLAEDPIKEVSAMQYLKQYYINNVNTNINNKDLSSSIIIQNNSSNTTQSTFQLMIETNVMIPLALLSDETYLYSIMPYCNGGELFELLDMNERFTEPQSRYWLQQILNGVETLQHAGICHRDMSLENLLVHESGALIIDMGMCLRIPIVEEPNTIIIDDDDNHHTSLSTTFDNMNMNHNNSNSNIQQQQQQQQSLINNINSTNNRQQQQQSVRNKKRKLILPQGTCGKWIYMSPEIYKNQIPFDGYAIDMWGVGVILFLMLTGFPPWDRPCLSDERFRYMTGGYLVQMLTEWEIGLSADAMDLLQRMLFIDPKDRLSLDQVRAHPWMINGPIQPPTDNDDDDDDF